MLVAAPHTTGILGNNFWGEKGSYGVKNKVH